MYSNPWPITPPETPDYKPSCRVIGDEKLEACTSSKRFLEFASPKVQFVLEGFISCMVGRVVDVCWVSYRGGDSLPW